MNPDVSDNHLVERAQAGDREAFLVLYNRYLQKVYNRVKSRVPAQDAEDVTQDIFIALVKSLPKFEQRSRFNTWLYTIVNRQIADYYRRFYRRKEDKMLSIDNYTGSSSKDPMSGVDNQLVIQQALGNLPEHYQEVILLRFADGMTFAEVAHQIGKSLEATKSLYRRAISALTEEMQEKS